MANAKALRLSGDSVAIERDSRTTGREELYLIGHKIMHRANEINQCFYCSVPLKWLGLPDFFEQGSYTFEGHRTDHKETDATSSRIALPC